MRVAVVILLILVNSAQIVQAQTPEGSQQPVQPGQVVTGAPGSQADTNDRMAKIGEVLLLFLILSLVFETALTPIFNWRLFAKHFEGKGWKTPITITLAFVVFLPYNLDIFSAILKIFGNDVNFTLVGGVETGYFGRFVTALLIAGGSDGIYRIFTKLGVRDPGERKKKAEEARSQTAATSTSPGT